jgi:hypothetical protein
MIVLILDSGFQPMARHAETLFYLFLPEKAVHDRSIQILVKRSRLFMDCKGIARRPDMGIVACDTPDLACCYGILIKIEKRHRFPVAMHDQVLIGVRIVVYNTFFTYTLIPMATQTETIPSEMGAFYTLWQLISDT